MSNIEKDIEILNNLIAYLNLLIKKGQHKIFYNNLLWDEKTVDCINAIENVLAERKQDKERIKELEAKLEFKKWGDLDNTQFEEYINEFISKQKIKDYLKEEKERFEVYKKESENNENLKLGMYKHLGAKNMCEKILGIEKIVTLD